MSEREPVDEWLYGRLPDGEYEGELDDPVLMAALHEGVKYDGPLRTLEPDGERIDGLERKLTAMTKWLEEHHPEVFREGLWDAILPKPNTGETE